MFLYAVVNSRLFILEENNVIYWLQGKTLLGVFKNGCLIEDDHDDDLSIWIGQKELVISIFQTHLSSIGFKKIRENEHMISFERDFRRGWTMHQNKHY